jgi:hypothetical protein
MAILFALFFGAGVAGFTYSKMNQRLGYGNNQSLWTVTIVVFIISAIVFGTVFTIFLPQ